METTTVNSSNTPLDDLITLKSSIIKMYLGKLWNKLIE